MQRVMDWIMLIVITVCALYLVFAFTSKTDKVCFSDCTFTIPNEQGTFCQRFDYKGNIYYVRYK